MKLTTKRIVIMAVIGALYAAAVIFFQPISFGPVQFRVANLLKALVLFSPHYSFGIAMGVFLGNITSPFGPLDYFIMPLIDLGMGLLAWKLRRWWYIGLTLQALVTAAGVSIFPLGLGARLPFWTTFPLIALAQLILGFVGYGMWRPFKKIIGDEE